MQLSLCTTFAQASPVYVNGSWIADAYDRRDGHEDRQREREREERHEHELKIIAAILIGIAIANH